MFHVPELNAVAEKNIKPVLVTFDTDHSDISELNATAPVNISYILVHDDVCHLLF